jgi:hypothetical protein
MARLALPSLEFWGVLVGAIVPLVASVSYLVAAHYRFVPGPLILHMLPKEVYGLAWTWLTMQLMVVGGFIGLNIAMRMQREQTRHSK